MTWNADKPDMNGTSTLNEEIAWTEQNLEHLKIALYTGWNPALTSAGAAQTWAYSSATAIVINEGVDYSTTYPIGTKLKFTQATGGTKYGEVTAISYSAPNFIMTIDFRGLHTIANEAISDPNFSNVYHPVGFPDWVLKSDGWINAFETWTYASATSFTVSGDRTTVFRAGTKLKMTNSTVKYFFVSSSSYSAPNTTVNLISNASYSLANAAITSNYWSYSCNPQGFPVSMSLNTITYTTSGSAFTNAPTTSGAIFWCEGNVIFFQIKFVSNATSGGTGFIYATLTGMPTPSLTYPACFGINPTDMKTLSAYYDHVNTRFIISLYDGTTPIANSKTYAISGKWTF